MAQQQQQQQTRIMNFFKKTVAKEPLEQAPSPSMAAAAVKEPRPVEGETSSSPECELPPGDKSADGPADTEAADCSAAKRPRLSVESPPRPPPPPPRPIGSPFAAFLPSPSSTGAGKENQQGVQQFLKSQPAAVQSLFTGFGGSWLLAMKPELVKPYVAKLAELIGAERAQGKVVYPPPGDVFTWTRACRLQDVKVVILGQDPYHGPNQAHGLCFSVRRPTVPPPSLINIYKEVAQNFPGKFQPPGHGDLTGWAEQGVLLLNAVLTVRRGEANSHQGRGWETFTDAVVSALNARSSSLVFILWGNYAQKKGAKIDKRRHRVICGAHPSPLSANQGGFFGKMYFKEANDYLASVGKSPIDWCHLP